MVLPDPPPGYSSLPHWLSELIDRKLKKLLDQGDFQRVRELSLALVTVLNEVGQLTRELVFAFPVGKKQQVDRLGNLPLTSTSRHGNLCECPKWSALTGSGSATTSPEL